MNAFLLAAKRTTSFPLNNGEGSGRNSINVPGTPGKFFIVFPTNLNSGEDSSKYSKITLRRLYVLNTNYRKKETFGCFPIFEFVFQFQPFDCETERK